jgi:hypothetical protein
MRSLSSSARIRLLPPLICASPAGVAAAAGPGAVAAVGWVELMRVSPLAPSAGAKPIATPETLSGDDCWLAAPPGNDRCEGAGAWHRKKNTVNRKKKRVAQKAQPIPRIRKIAPGAADAGHASLMRPSSCSRRLVRGCHRYAKVRTDTLAVIAALLPGGIMHTSRDADFRNAAARRAGGNFQFGPTTPNVKPVRHANR